MSILTNPVTVSVIVLCVLSLLKLNVLLAMLVACIAGGLAGGIPIYAAEGDSVMKLLTSGFSGNATTALAYVLLGTFATAIATTGLADIVSKKLSKIIGTKKLVLLGMITLIACLSQNLIPIHIAYIPILIPPMLVLMNKMRLDRRAVACCLAFGHKAPYIRFPLHGRRALHDELFAVPCGTAPAGTGRGVRKAHIACAAGGSNRCQRFHVPLDRLHAYRADGGDDVVVILAERAADERRADAGERRDLIVAGIYVRDDLVGSQGIVVVVRIGMVHQLVAALNDGLGLLGVLVRPVADNEKGTLHAVVREHIKDLLCVVRPPG